MKVIPYASAIGSIKYAMLCPIPIVYVIISLARGYGQSYHNLPKRTKEIFLDYGGDKEFIVKSYVDARFYNDPDDSKYQSRYILKVGAIS